MKRAAVARLVIGTDGSPAASAAIRYGSDLAAQLGAEVVLVHAVGLLEHLPGHTLEPAAGVRSEVLRLLSTTWCQPLVDSGVSFRCVLEDGPPLLALPRVSEREGADVIVVASHGHTGAHGLLVGSTAHGLVQSSPVPVLVVPSRPRSDR